MNFISLNLRDHLYQLVIHNYNKNRLMRFVALCHDISQETFQTALIIHLWNESLRYATLCLTSSFFAFIYSCLDEFLRNACWFHDLGLQVVRFVMFIFYMPNKILPEKLKLKLDCWWYYHRPIAFYSPVNSLVNWVIT